MRHAQRRVGVGQVIVGQAQVHQTPADRAGGGRGVMLRHFLLAIADDVVAALLLVAPSSHSSLPRYWAESAETRETSYSALDTASALAPKPVSPNV